jgi:hypothetical protein
MLMQRPRQKAVRVRSEILPSLFLIRIRPVERINLKRVPVLPRGSHTVSAADNAPQTIVPVRYETTI